VPDCQAKAPKKIGVHGVARIRCEGAQKYMKLFVAHKMAQINTLNKVYVSATELSHLLSQNTNYVWRGNRTKSLSDFVQL